MRQYRVRFPNYPQGQRQVFQQPLGASQGGEVVQYLLDVVAAGWGFRFLSGTAESIPS